MTIVMAEEVIRREPLPPLPCSRRVEPTRWLCPPPGRERRELAGHLTDEAPILARTGAAAGDGMSTDEATDTPPQPPKPEFTAPMVEAIYAAWHGAGVDIAGGNWTRFVGMLPMA